jgi:diguanylate cyclase (GGDEF)-like protein
MTHRSLLRTLALGVFVLMLMLAWQLRQSHDTAVQQATEDAANLVSILDGHLTATMRRIESNLVNIAGQLPAAALEQRAVPGHRARIQVMLQPFTLNFPEVTGYYVWDADGDLLYATTPTAPGAGRRTIAIRPGYQALRSDPALRIAFSDSIRSFLTGQQTVAIYVPVRDARGRLRAVVTATLNLDRIGDIFQSLRVPTGSVVFMRRTESHRLVIRYPSIESEFNKAVRNSISQRIDAGQTSGRDRFRAVTDGEYRIYGFRKLEGYPFYVVVGLAETGALANWRANALAVVAALVLMGLALLFLLWRASRAERLRQSAQQQAREALELLREALNSITAGIVIYDPQDRLVMCNEPLRRIYSGMDDLIVPGRTFEEITRAAAERGIFPLAVGRVDAWMAERMRRHQVADGRPDELALDDGRWIQFSEYRTPGGYTVGSRLDITERKRLEAELREQASTDALTGLPNRRQFLGRLEEELERVRRGTTRQACVLMLDLDHFKRINDQFGHAAGDSVLRHFGALLSGELRAADTAGRMGGEEFAIILPGADTASAAGFAERICQRMAGRPLSFGAQQIAVTVSVGIAGIAATDLSPDGVLARADAALYQAKAGGRNRVQVSAD